MNQNGMNYTEPAVETSVDEGIGANAGTADAGSVAASGSSIDQAKEKLMDASGQAREKLTQASSQAKDKIMEASSQAKEKLLEKGAQLGEKADATIHSVGERVHQLADKVREKAPTDGKMSQRLSRVADSLDTSADYLAQHGLSDIQSDVTDLVRKYPVQALGAGLVLGFLVGATLSRR